MHNLRQEWQPRNAEKGWADLVVESQRGQAVLSRKEVKVWWLEGWVEEKVGGANTSASALLCVRVVVCARVCACLQAPGSAHFLVCAKGRLWGVAWGRERAALGGLLCARARAHACTGQLPAHTASILRYLFLTGGLFLAPAHCAPCRTRVWGKKGYRRTPRVLETVKQFWLLLSSKKKRESDGHPPPRGKAAVASLCTVQGEAR